MPESKFIQKHPQTGEASVRIPDRMVSLSSAALNWRGVVVERHSYDALELPEYVGILHGMSLQLSAPITLEDWERGRFREHPIAPGGICMTPAGVWRKSRWFKPVEILAFGFEAAFMEKIAYESLRLNRLEFRDVMNEYDPQSQHIGMALKAELDSGGVTGRLYAETLTTALVARMVHRFAVFPPDAPDAMHPMARTELRRAIEYIYDNLDSDLSLQDIADAAGLSVHYFSRLFRQTTGQAPHQYVIAQRIERAKPLLRYNPERSIAEIAVEVGFYDQSHFIRHFRVSVGVNPGAYRASSG